MNVSKKIIFKYMLDKEKIIVKDKTKLENKDYHFDTFHHTFKAWLFLGNVR